MSTMSWSSEQDAAVVNDDKPGAVIEAALAAKALAAKVLKKARNAISNALRSKSQITISNKQRSKTQIGISNARRPKGSSRSLKYITAVKHSNKKWHVLGKERVYDYYMNKWPVKYGAVASIQTLQKLQKKGLKASEQAIYNEIYVANAYLKKYGLKAGEEATFSMCTGLKSTPP